MPYIKVNVNKINDYSSTINSYTQELVRVYNTYVETINSAETDILYHSGAKEKIFSISEELKKEATTLNQMGALLSQVAIVYASLDDPLGMNSPDIYLPAKIDLGLTDLEKPDKWGSAYVNGLGTKVTDNSASAYLVNAYAGADWGWGNAEIDAYVGKAEASFDTSFAFGKATKTREKKKDGTWEEKETMEFISIGAEVGASVQVLGAEGSLNIGDDMAGFGISGEGGIGVAEAKGEIGMKIDDDGKVIAKAEGKAMVAAAQGKAEATFSIFGLDIKISAGGYAGAIGAEGEIGFENGKFKMEGGVAAILGFSLGIEIGFNDAGWENFKETVSDAVEAVGDFVSDTVETVGDFVNDAVNAVGDFFSDVGETIADGAKSFWNAITSW